MPAGLEFTPFVEARGDLAGVVKGGDLSFELIQIRFPVRLEGRNRGGEIIPERCRNALTVQGFDNWDTLGKACLSTASAVDHRIILNFNLFMNSECFLFFDSSTTISV